MHVEETHLGDRLWSNVMVGFVLRARFKATTAGHTARVGVAFLDILLVHARTGSQIVGAVEFDPGMHTLQVIEHL